jgi:hypothetical protein
MQVGRELRSSEFLGVPRSSSKFLGVPRGSSGFLGVPRSSSGQRRRRDVAVSPGREPWECVVRRLSPARGDGPSPERAGTLIASIRPPKMRGRHPGLAPWATATSRLRRWNPRNSVCNSEKTPRRNRGTPRNRGNSAELEEPRKLRGTRGTQKNSEETPRNPRNSEELRRTPRNSEELRGTPRNSEELRGTRGTRGNSEELRRTQKNSEEAPTKKNHADLPAGVAS